MLEKINSPRDLKSLDISQLESLADEIRQLIIDTVLKTGGHLASNLGDVELTLALEYVFDPTRDKIAFDVGHQSYTHKILTGRKEAFSRLREKDGLSGFTRISESECDAFSAGHASTAISAALGMARSRDLLGQDHAVVAVVGDGALTGGMCYEALNDAGSSRTPLIVVLNDNEMSISKNVGALSKHLTRMRQGRLYGGVRRGVKRGLGRLPLIGDWALKLFRTGVAFVRRLLLGEHFFEALGVRYLGPIDGHDLATMIDVFKKASRTDEPVLIHVVTQKGRGYAPAEQAPDRFHGVSPANPGKDHIKAVPSGAVAAKALIDMARTDQRVAVITAAMPQGTGMSAFSKEIPGRFFDVGIAEEHMVTMAAGMAATGMKPYVCVYSTFLQRGYDQLLHDVCLEKLPVTLLIDRAGLVGPDGATHQGVFDLSYLRQMPGMTVASPRNGAELEAMIRLSASYDSPMAIRYAREIAPQDGSVTDIPFGKWETIRTGDKCVILAVGRMNDVALQAAGIIEKAGRSCGVVNARFIKPMDTPFLLSIEKDTLVVTLEDNTVAGGFGSSVLEAYAAAGQTRNVLTLGVPDKFISHATVSEQMRACGIDAESVARRILSRLSGLEG